MPIVHYFNHLDFYKPPSTPWWRVWLTKEWRLMLRCGILHFLFSGCVGSLVFWSISTTFGSPEVLTLLFSVSVAGLAHVLEDYWLGWF